MDARLLENTYYYNRLHLTNYETFSSDKVLANEIVLQGRTSNNENNLNLNNYVPQTTRLANVLQFRSYNYESGGINWKGHAVTLTNYKEDTQTEANKITMSTQQASMRLYNYNRSSTGYANKLELSANNTATNNLDLVNYKKNTTSTSDIANEMWMKGYALNPGSGYENALRINNYDVDSNSLSASLLMAKSSSANYLSNELYRGGNLVAALRMEKDSSQYVRIRLGTENVTVSGTTYYATDLQMIANSGLVLMLGKKFWFNDQSNNGYVYELKFPSLSVGSSGNLQVTRVQ